MQATTQLMLLLLLPLSPPSDGNEGGGSDGGKNYSLGYVEEDAEEETTRIAAEEEEALLPSTYKTLFQSRNVTARWGGRIFLDAGFITADASYIDDEGGIGGDGAAFRSARLWAEGTVHDAVDFKAEYEFVDDDGYQFEDVFIAMRTPLGKIRVGHFKEPFSLEQMTDARYITFTERSVADAFAPARNIGLMVEGYEQGFNDLNWAVGVFRPSDDGSPSLGEGQYSFTGRLTSTAYNQNDSSQLLHYGGALSYRADDRGTSTLTSDPEISLLAPLGGIMMQPSDGGFDWNVELAWVDGPISLQGEYFVSTTDATGGDIDASGYYVMGSYFMTGEKRQYQADGGVFGRVKVGGNYDGGGGSGTLELKVRYSTREFDSAPSVTPTPFIGNELTNYSAGLNWYLNPHTRIMLDYVHSEYESGSTNDSMEGVVVRFQLDF